jgi:hypothetical protein
MGVAAAVAPAGRDVDPADATLLDVEPVLVGGVDVIPAGESAVGIAATMACREKSSGSGARFWVPAGTWPEPPFKVPAGATAMGVDRSVACGEDWDPADEA